MGNRILITGTEGWAIDQVRRDLARAGHEVVECAEAEDPSFPCVGPVRGTCPLERAVDVVLCVRARPLLAPTRHEVVVRCADEDHVPLVVAGATMGNPFGDRSTEVVEGLDPAAIGQAVERAARRRLNAADNHR